MRGQASLTPGFNYPYSGAHLQPCSTGRGSTDPERPWPHHYPILSNTGFQQSRFFVIYYGLKKKAQCNFKRVRHVPGQSITMGVDAPIPPDTMNAAVPFWVRPRCGSMTLSYLKKTLLPHRAPERPWGGEQSQQKSGFTWSGCEHPFMCVSPEQVFCEDDAVTRPHTP